MSTHSKVIARTDRQTDAGGKYIADHLQDVTNVKNNTKVTYNCYTERN